ncbi:hypothetical protein V8J82_15700 [Gymnodinialimonas sp. 2305UL16-5]
MIRQTTEILTRSRATLMSDLLGLAALAAMTLAILYVPGAL